MAATSTTITTAVSASPTAAAVASSATATVIVAAAMSTATTVSAVIVATAVKLRERFVNLCRYLFIEVLRKSTTIDADEINQCWLGRQPRGLL